MPIAKEQKKVAAAGAADRKQEPSNKFEGKVVSITGDKLVMRNKEGNKFSHTLAKDAKLTCGGGKACKAEDLKPGIEIRVTTKKDDRNVATAVECLDKNKASESCCS